MIDKWHMDGMDEWQMIGLMTYDGCLDSSFEFKGSRDLKGFEILLSRLFESWMIFKNPLVKLHFWS